MKYVKNCGTQKGLSLLCQSKRTSYIRVNSEYVFFLLSISCNIVSSDKIYQSKYDSHELKIFYILCGKHDSNIYNTEYAVNTSTFINDQRTSPQFPHSHGFGWNRDHCEWLWLLHRNSKEPCVSGPCQVCNS